jgi:hypothetical protein
MDPISAIIGGAMLLIIGGVSLEGAWTRFRARRQLAANTTPLVDTWWDTAPPNPDPVPHEAPLNPAPASAQLGAFSTEQWRDALNDSPHLLIYGPSKAGKSTLAQAIVAMFDGCEYVVIDPMPNKPGESKWGGIDFITLDETGSDEYASIKAAFAAIQAEDQRRRKAMRTEIARPLVVIVDEVLQLVDALGTVKTPDGKTEPRMTQFMRGMGATARHRNIKIILLGQGKNLADLGLSSSTARNNYALIRVARDNATNERSAWIDAGGREQAMDIRYVPMLAQRAAQRARLWLSHDALACTPDADALLETLFHAPAPSESPWTPDHVRVAAWLAAEPAISDREIGRRLYPGTDGGGSYSVKAKVLREAVLRVTNEGVTPLQNGQNGPNAPEL